MRNEHVKDLGHVLFLDIETVPEVYRWSDVDPARQVLWDQKSRYRQASHGKSAEEVYKEAGIFAEFGKIICIGVGRIDKKGNAHRLRVTTLHGDDERDVLLRFVELLDRHYHGEEHRLCAHNGKEFDFPYIARRCVIHGIPLPRLLDVAGAKPWEVGHLDTMELWSFGDRKNFSSLALLTHILGIESPKDDITGADVARVYHEDRDLDRIAAYCRKDVVATAQLFMRLTGRSGIPAEHIEQV